jgi:GH25 family lysozyme M1 (1,4-beta-N-acetylmuramidase)
LALRNSQALPALARGIDVSYVQGRIDWGRVAASGVQFVYIRAGLGTTLDAAFAENWEGTKAAGIRRGAYQAFNTDLATVQADVLLKQLTGYAVDDLPPALNINPSQALLRVDAEEVGRWVSIVKERTDRIPVIFVWPINRVKIPSLPIARLWTVGVPSGFHVAVIRHRRGKDAPPFRTMGGPG